MIKKVGLILPGNEEQIPFAYELYADLGHNVEDSLEMAERFKETFSRDNVQVHFLGAWDTVSSIGIIRGKSLPVTNTYNDGICYFRHALALDERRVKFLPEYVCGGDTYVANRIATPNTSPTNTPTERENQNRIAGADYVDANGDRNQIMGKTSDRVKEVWFAGCHSDIGGGSKSNKHLNNAAVPVLWMGNEATLAGLKLRPSRVEWKWEELENTKPTESLKPVWYFFEILPFKTLSYGGAKKYIWWPHCGKGRVIQPGQKIHASVSFIHNYQPKATFSRSMTGKGWNNILGVGKKDGVDWADGITDRLEMDLFDLSNITTIIDKVSENLDDVDSIGRLEFLASTREGAQAIVRADPNFEVSCKMLHGGAATRATGVVILSNLLPYDARLAIMKVDIAQPLSQAAESENDRVRTSCAKVLQRVSRDYATRSKMLRGGVINSLINMIKSRHDAERLEAIKALYGFVRHSDARVAFTEAGDMWSTLEILFVGDHWSILTILELCNDDGFLDEAIKRKAMSKLIDCVWNLSPHEDYAGLRAIASLFFKRNDARIEFLESGVLSWIVKRIEAGNILRSKDNAMTLSRLVTEDIVQKILRDNGVIKHLIDTIGIQPFVTDILSVLAARPDARAEILDALSMLSPEKIHQDLGLVQILAELAQHGDTGAKNLKDEIVATLVELYKSTDGNNKEKYLPALAALSPTTKYAEQPADSGGRDLTGQVMRTESDYFAYGGSADVWKGKWVNTSGQVIEVAIKVPKFIPQRRVLREIEIWSKIQHPNITPFLGQCRDFGRLGTTCLVIPYYQHGNIRRYLEKQPDVNRLALLTQVASALSFLHSQSIIYGDLKGSNILINDNGDVHLADFGLSCIMGSSELTTKAAAAGTYRYMAPELFNEIAKTTQATDVWAFAMTAIEIFTGSMPFSNIINEASVIFSVMSGGRPKREFCLQIDEDIWAMLEKCWCAVPERRPEMDTVYHFLVASTRGGLGSGQRLSHVQV